jgi:hypothetical protein
LTIHWYVAPAASPALATNRVLASFCLSADAVPLGDAEALAPVPESLPHAVALTITVQDNSSATNRRRSGTELGTAGLPDGAHQR